MRRLIEQFVLFLDPFFQSAFGGMVFNATFNNISAIPWRPVSLAEEIEVPGENHRPVLCVCILCIHQFHQHNYFVVFRKFFLQLFELEKFQWYVLNTINTSYFLQNLSYSQ